MGVPIAFFQFFKKSHFWSFFGVFLVKIDPKMVIFTKVSAHFLLVGYRTDVRLKMGLLCPFRGMPSLVPKFAFLVPEIGFITPPPQFEEFSEIGTFHKVCAHFLLASFRTDFTLKMGFLGVPLGARQAAHAT